MGGNGAVSFGSVRIMGRSWFWIVVGRRGGAVPCVMSRGICGPRVCGGRWPVVLTAPGGWSPVCFLFWAVQRCVCVADRLLKGCVASFGSVVTAFAEPM